MFKFIVVCFWVNAGSVHFLSTLFFKVKKQEGEKQKNKKTRALNISRAQEVSSWLLAPCHFRKYDYPQLLKGHAQSKEASFDLLCLFSCTAEGFRKCTVSHLLIMSLNQVTLNASLQLLNTSQLRTFFFFTKKINLGKVEKKKTKKKDQQRSLLPLSKARRNKNLLCQVETMIEGCKW